MFELLHRRGFLKAIAASGVFLHPRLVLAGNDRDGFVVLTARAGEKRLLPEPAVAAGIWGYNGDVPGPVLRVRQGDELKVRFVNQLDQSSLIHWHGIRLDNAMDGTVLTQQPVEPGESFDYVFTPPDAGTFWYHPHIRSAQQVDRGLQGVLIVDEREPLTTALDDLVMVIDDWRLREDGAIDTDSYGNLMMAAHAGRIGNWLTVNGQSRPTLPARADRPVRLRLINTANALIMPVVIKGPEARIIAIDGQPVSPLPLPGDPLPLGTGARIDLLLPPSPDMTRIGLMLGGEVLEAAYVERTGEPAGATADPMAGFALPANPLPPTLDLDAVKPVDLVMEGGAMGRMASASYQGQQMSMRQLVSNGIVWAFNGVGGMPETPLFQAEKGETVAVRMVNRTAFPHTMHLHGHHVRTVAVDGKPVEDPVWRDVVLVDPDQEVTIALVADNPGKWMFHCHILEHQEAGMMTWFEVA